MLIRDYAETDAATTLDVFERAITTTGRARYTQEQVEAWLGAPRELARWGAERLEVRTFVAEHDGVLAGFADLEEGGYVNRLFVDPRFGRRGVAHALLDHVRAAAVLDGLPELTTHSSLVARPVFERAGFRVVHDEVVRRGDVTLQRFFMRAPRPVDDRPLVEPAD
ncbi:GNAT family N-acetyltransferase [Actinotalea sp. BY-33]|uniref:GNAT family N-acetyltransferase n=1 Tax=Actinotalea soli TaxID=2819234 RepID=A0A939LS74_9CELL|nr:GNAT family N-acetyltransferase [Actinotalea soli]MBO1752090.1 GNAT family N-acetyltransferase [Actinotalea soli]